MVITSMCQFINNVLITFKQQRSFTETSKTTNIGG